MGETVKVYKVGTNEKATRLLATKEHQDFYDYAKFWAERLSKTWRKPTFYIRDPKAKEADFYNAAGSGCLVFNERVLESDLGELLEKYGEILPAYIELNGSRKEIYFANTLACYPCLNMEKSVLRYSTSGAVLVEVKKYELYDDRILDSSIFKIPEMVKGDLYSIERPGGESPMQYVAENKFIGISFEEIWSGPWPPFAVSSVQRPASSNEQAELQNVSQLIQRYLESLDGPTGSKNSHLRSRASSRIVHKADMVYLLADLTEYCKDKGWDIRTMLPK